MAQLYTPTGGYNPYTNAQVSLNSAMSTGGPIPGATATPTTSGTPSVYTDPNQALGAANTAGANVQGMLSYLPQWEQQNNAQTMSDYQVPQSLGSYNDMVKMYQLYLHDQNMNSQYASPGLNQAGAAGTAAPAPTMTAQNVASPFSGFTDPWLAMSAGNQQLSGLLGSINNLGSAIDYNKTAAQGANQISLDAFKTLISGEQSKQTTALDIWKTLASLASTAQTQALDWQKEKAYEYSIGYDPTGDNEKTASVAADVFNGKTDFTTLDAKTQQEVRAWLKTNEGTTPEQLKKDALTQQKADASMTKAEWKLSDTSGIPFFGQKYIQNQITGQKIDVSDPGKSITFQNPDNGTSYSVKVGSPDFENFLSAGYQVISN